MACMCIHNAMATTCPVCECNHILSRDSYAGFRLYVNQHSTYSYHAPDGTGHRKNDDNLGFGTTMGNNLTKYLRVEYETLYMGAQYSADNTNFEYDIWANMLNAYLYWEFDNAFAPYAGLGVGLTGIWGEVAGHLDNAFDLSYQFLAGVLFRLNSRIDLDLGFKYVNFGKVENQNTITKVDATQIYVGATYKFGMQ